MDETARRKFNEKVLRKHDPKAQTILSTASFVVLYTHENDHWTKTGTEGPMFVYQRAKDPRYAVYIMNRNAIDDFTTDITASSDLDLSSEYIIFSSPPDNPADLDDGPTYGIWVFEEGQRALVANTLKVLFDRSSQAASASTSDDAPEAGRSIAGNIDSLPPPPEAPSASIDVEELLASARRSDPHNPTSDSVDVSSDPAPVDESASLMSMLGLGPDPAGSSSPALPGTTSAAAPAAASAPVSVPVSVPASVSAPTGQNLEPLTSSPAVAAPPAEPTSPSPMLLRSVVQNGLVSGEVPGAPKLPRREFVTALLNRIHTEPEFVDQLYADYLQRP